MDLRSVDARPLILPHGLEAEIIAHARLGYPEEVCGLVGGRGNAAAVVVAGRNVAAAPATAYELDVRTLARLAELEDAGLELVAIYHSHPDGPAAPSFTDIERAAYPDSAHLIISLAGCQQPVVAAYRIAGGQVTEIRLEREHD